MILMFGLLSACYCYLYILNKFEIKSRVLKEWAGLEKSHNVLLWVLATGTERSSQRSEPDLISIFL